MRNEMQVASVTILSATSSSWCLVGAFLTGKEQLIPPNPNVVIKCAAVVLNLVGVAVVALADETPGIEHGAEDGIAEASANADGGDEERTQAEHSVLGDTVAIGSALCYAVYTTMLEQKLGDDADADMLSLFAFLGALHKLLVDKVDICSSHSLACLSVLRHRPVRPGDYGSGGCGCGLARHGACACHAPVAGGPVAGSERRGARA